MELNLKCVTCLEKFVGDGRSGGEGGIRGIKGEVGGCLLCRLDVRAAALFAVSFL